MSRVISVRLPDHVERRLREWAATVNEPASGLAQRLVDEGLRMEAHPGIVFRSGPSGRRASLVRGPDVWEIVGLVKSLEVRGEQAITEAAEWLKLSESQIRVALGYYGDFSEEIDARIAANDAAAEHAERSWRTQQRLLQ